LHFLEQILEVDAAGGAVEDDRIGLEHRAFERFAARDIRHGGAGPDRNPQPHPPERDPVHRQVAGCREFLERGRGSDHHVEGFAATDALADLGRGVESDIDVVAGLLLKGGSRGSQARLDRAGAQDPDLSRHRAARSQRPQRTQQQTRRDLHFLFPGNYGKLPQAYSARAPESLTTCAHFGISRARMSLGPPGVKPTTKRAGFSGQPWPGAPPENATAMNNAAAMRLMGSFFADIILISSHKIAKGSTKKREKKNMKTAPQISPV